MPLVKRIQGRGGANIVVTAEAELLFLPGGMVSRWNNSLSQRVRGATAAVAPRNKRPRWAHYGKPLNKSIKASTDLQVRPGGGYARTAVGSSAPYALFVDQGTKSFNAKILPPWRRFSPSLYEHSWKVPVNTGTDAEGKAIITWEEVGTIRVSGQMARYFFEAGLVGGLASFGVYTRREFGSSAVSRANRTFPDRLANYVTTDYNGTNAAFVAQLEEWRAWRDAAWANDIPLGENRPLTNRRDILERRYNAKRAERQQRKDAQDAARRDRKRRNQENYRRRNGARPRREYERERRMKMRSAAARAADKAAFLAAIQRKYGVANVDANSVTLVGTRWAVLVREPGARFFEPKYGKAKFLQK